MRNYAELHEVVKSKADRSGCAICGHRSWITTVRIVRLPLVSEEDESTEPAGPEAMIFACKGCGHIRLFLLSVIEELAKMASNGRDDT